MSRFTLPLTIIVMLGAVASSLFMTLGGRSLSDWVLFSMTLAVIAIGANTFDQVRQVEIGDLFAFMPVLPTLVLLVAAVYGASQMSESLSNAMPRVSPSGAAVHSYSADVSDGECRATYNKSEEVVVPMAACEDLVRSFSSGVAGAWLVFGSIAMWLALLLAKNDDGHAQKG